MAASVVQLPRSISLEPRTAFASLDFPSRKAKRFASAPPASSQNNLPFSIFSAPASSWTSSFSPFAYIPSNSSFAPIAPSPPDSQAPPSSLLPLPQNTPSLADSLQTAPSLPPTERSLSSFLLRQSVPRQHAAAIPDASPWSAAALPPAYASARASEVV